MTAASPLHPRHSVVARCAASARRAPCPTAEGVGSMRREELNDRLSRITTCWTVLRQAHQGSADAAAATAAQQLLMKRYGGAIYRYLLKALGDPNAADDLTQEFGLSVVRGEVRRADPQRG